jgi:hypothetical protein
MAGRRDDPPGAEGVSQSGQNERHSNLTVVGLSDCTD